MAKMSRTRAGSAASGKGALSAEGGKQSRPFIKAVAWCLVESCLWARPGLPPGIVLEAKDTFIGNSSWRWAN